VSSNQVQAEPLIFIASRGVELELIKLVRLLTTSRSAVKVQVTAVKKHIKRRDQYTKRPTNDDEESLYHIRFH
jgi:RNA-binding protein YhbY